MTAKQIVIWASLVIAVLAVWFSCMFRYAPIGFSSSEYSPIWLWDRWTNQPCFTAYGRVVSQLQPGAKIVVCSKSDSGG